MSNLKYRVEVRRALKHHNELELEEIREVVTLTQLRSTVEAMLCAEGSRPVTESFEMTIKYIQAPWYSITEEA